jgi:hypothetical protein
LLLLTGCGSDQSTDSQTNRFQPTPPSTQQDVDDDQEVVDTEQSQQPQAVATTDSHQPSTSTTAQSVAEPIVAPTPTPTPTVAPVKVWSLAELLNTTFPNLPFQDYSALTNPASGITWDEIKAKSSTPNGYNNSDCGTVKLYNFKDVTLGYIPSVNKYRVRIDNICRINP